VFSDEFYLCIQGLRSLKVVNFMTNLKVERSVEWALGSVDDLLFAFSTSLWQLKKKPTYLSDTAQLAQLHQQQPGLAPDQLFLPPSLPVVTLQSIRLPVLARQFGAIGRQYRAFHLEYPSAVSTGYAANDVVRAIYLEHIGAENSPAVIYLHGWMEFEPGLSLRLPLSWFGAMGLNILALHLPFHFERTPPDKLSGELSITGNLPLALKGLQQAISDVRQALYWLKQRNCPVALLGKSLGGLVGAMTLAVEPGFEAGALVVPATSTRSTIWHSRYTRLIRRDLTRQGLDEETTSQLLEVVRPGHYQPSIDPRRILVLKAKADRVCFPFDTDHFVQQWGANLVEIPTGHLTATFAPQARRAVHDHLQRYLLPVF
jgi:pimeloyl-ACP methyl ester carboxylesterase